MDKNAVSGMTTRKKANTIVVDVVRKPGYIVTTRSSSAASNNDVDMMDEFWPNDEDSKLLVVSRTRKRTDHDNRLFRCRDNGDESKHNQERRLTRGKRGRQQLFGGIKRGVHTDEDFDFNTAKCMDGVNERLAIGSGGDNNDNAVTSKVSTATNPVCPMTTREKRSSMAQIISSRSRYNPSDKPLDNALHRPVMNQNRSRIIHSSNDDVDIIRAVDESVQWWKPIDHTLTTTTTTRVPLSSMNDDDELFTLLLRTGTQHHGPCIGTYIWDFLSLRDLCQLRMVSNDTYLQLAWVEYNGCGDGKDYLVPFPGKLGPGLTPYQIASFRAMHHAENQATHFGSLRGGKLSDINHARASSSGPIRGNVTVPTMLSIIANTAGMKPVTPKAFFDIESIDQHWTNMLLDPNRHDEILKLIEPFRWYGDNDRSKDWRHPASPRYDELARYISLNADRFPTLASFEQYVLRQVKSDSTLHERHTFRRKIVQLKIQLDRGDNFNCTRDQKERILFERNLIPSGATLVIVPDNAHLDHWVDHIRSRHPNLEVILDCKHLRNVTEMLKCSEDKGVVFVEYEENIHRRAWEDTFPSVYNIERCTIVLVTYARIRRDSNLLEQVRWFRIVVDEGQAELGLLSIPLLGDIQMSHPLRNSIHRMGAERRWVMGGTTFPIDEDDDSFSTKDLDQIERILMLLRYEKYGVDMDAGMIFSDIRGATSTLRNRNWIENVKKPYLNGRQRGIQELYRVLGEVMIRHSDGNAEAYYAVS